MNDRLLKPIFHQKNKVSFITQDISLKLRCLNLFSWPDFVITSIQNVSA